MMMPIPGTLGMRRSTRSVSPTLRILILERGGYLKREYDNWSAQAVFVDAKYQARETWYGADGQSFHPGLHYCVGGNTKVYGGALFRLRERDFARPMTAGRIVFDKSRPLIGCLTDVD